MKGRGRTLAAAGLALCLGACATARREAAGAAPDLAPPVGAPAPAHAALYADCIGRAIADRRVDLTADSSTQMLRFTCEGPAADALYAALAPWSATRGMEWRRDGRTWRSTIKVKHDLFGVDYCSSADTGGARCVLTLNGGPFLIAP